MKTVTCETKSKSVHNNKKNKNNNKMSEYLTPDTRCKKRKLKKYILYKAIHPYRMEKEYENNEIMKLWDLELQKGYSTCPHIASFPQH